MNKRKQLQNENGIALVVATMVLFAVTIIGLGAVTTSNIATNVSGNLKIQSQAYHAAESCLYYQIRRVRDGGALTTELNYNIGDGMSCTATAPQNTGGFAGSGGTLVGYSAEEGAGSVAFVSYFFTVTGVGPHNTQSVMDVTIKLPIAVGG